MGIKFNNFMQGRRNSRRKNSSEHLNSGNRVTLHNMKIGETAKIIKLHGGPHFINKAESLGIREGIDIKIISAQILQGPFTIQVGHTKIAIGHGMSYKIEVEKK